MSEEKDARQAVYFFPFVADYIPKDDGEWEVGPDGKRTKTLHLRIHVEGMMSNAKHELMNGSDCEKFDFWLEEYVKLWIANKMGVTLFPLEELPEGFVEIVDELGEFIEHPEKIARELVAAARMCLCDQC